MHLNWTHTAVLNRENVVRIWQYGKIRTFADEWAQLPANLSSTPNALRYAALCPTAQSVEEKYALLRTNEHEQRLPTQCRYIKEKCMFVHNRHSILFVSIVPTLLLKSMLFPTLCTEHNKFKLVFYVISWSVKSVILLKSVILQMFVNSITFLLFTLE